MMYTFALGAIAAIPGSDLPSTLAAIATGIGVEALGSILDRIAYDDNNVSDKEIFEEMKRAVEESGIAELLSTNKQTQGQLIRLASWQRHLKYVIEAGDREIVKNIAEQYLLISYDISLIRENLQELATKEQNEEIKRTLYQIVSLLEAQIASKQQNEISVNIPKALQLYVERLRNESSRLNFPGIPYTPTGISPSLEDIYILQILDNSKTRTKYSYFLRNLKLLVEEKAGFGKSMLLKRIAIDYCNQYLSNQREQIPVKLDARDIVLSGNGRFDDWLVKSLTSQTGLNEVQIRRTLNTRGVSLIVDGLDEASKEQRRDFYLILQRSNLVQEDGNQIIVASRPLGNIGLNSFDELVKLYPFSIYDAYQLVERWEKFFKRIETDELAQLEHLKTKISSFSGKEGLMPESLKVPLYLTYLIFLTISQGGEEALRILDNKISLYKRILEVVIRTWEESKQHDTDLKPDIAELSTMYRMPIICAIAFILQEQGKTNTSLAKNTLLIHLERIRNDYLAGMTVPMIEAWFKYWINSNVLVVNEPNFEQVSFWHREMQEYCAARYLAEKYRSSDLDMEEESQHKLYHDEDWQNVRRLYNAISRDPEHQI